MTLIANSAPLWGIAGLIIAGGVYLFIKRQPAGSDLMQGIAAQIHEGAMVYLKRQYSILVVFIVLVFAALSFGIGVWTAIAFLAGAVCSMSAGFFGMNAATRANVRTAQAAHVNKNHPGKALSMAFAGGSVMGLSVASLGLLGVGVFFLFFGHDPTQA
ncbi:MAG TPA: sodium/proton-translocating pyrophosphatase, partial [Nitrospiria bacterium]|nr:sodium/proton-translocating pyrophosphatase [Nitrospiria bacterium]